MNIDFHSPSFYSTNKHKFPKVVIGKQTNFSAETVYLLTDFERHIVSKIVESLSPGSTYLEIGCLSGWNMINVALSNPNIKKLAIDLFSYDSSVKEYNITGEDHVYRIALNNLKKHNLLFDVQLFKGDSRKLINILPNDSIDCVFVDGDHSYNGCFSDIIELWPKLKNNSIMFGHDSRNSDVKNAVTKIFESNIIQCPWGFQKFNFTNKILDIATHLNMNDINNGMWFCNIQK